MASFNKTLIILLGTISALAFAFYWQYAQHMHPCELCLWQRWGYAWVILVSLVALMNRSLNILVSLSLAVEFAIAIYHTGIELHWWAGWQNCSSLISGGESLEEIREKLMNTPLVRCDEPVWRFARLSMAGWNALYSALLFVVSLLPCRKYT